MAITVETLQFAARDGRPLTGSLHIPPVSNRRAVLINSALGTPRARYDAFARFLAEAGFSVLSYDNRGIGGSRTAVGDADRVRLRQWGEADLPAALDCLAARLPEARQFAVGHATGGRLLGLAPNLGQLSGIVTIAAGTAYRGDARGLAGIRLALAGYLTVPLAGRLLSRVPGRLLLGAEADVPAGIARDWARGCRQAGGDLDAEGLASRAGFEAYRGPLLAYAVEDDPLAPSAAVSALHRQFIHAEVESRWIAPHPGHAPIGQAGYFREDNRGLWPSLAGWLAAC
ncbi:alpha/beta fold hydrolase [Burkholderia gladioli]|uniref:alpha/beta hydrolase family protein n=1 Tax=Burkholderia gladioli TaxID=28095 RepID=UPI000F540A71|nr:alpha/beta fold hydrolase [Burkholderia gladioli]